MLLLSHGLEAAAVLLGLANVGIPSVKAPTTAATPNALTLPR
jgi:hypothetical protein